MKKDNNQEVKKSDKNNVNKKQTENQLKSSFIKKSVAKEKEKPVLSPVHTSHDKPESKEEIEVNKKKLKNWQKPIQKKF